MRRSDRHDDSYDNTVNHPRSQQAEPFSAHELKSTLMTVRANLSELQQQAKEHEAQVQHNHQLYLDEQQKYQGTLTLYREAETKAQSYLTRYNDEKDRSSALLVQYETVLTERDRYLTLYNETEAQLKFERRSKAGIKGWETRRKRENERLKQEISEMTLLLRDSLIHKDEAIDNLYELANRMDRIQELVDLVEADTSSSPIGFLQKMARVWQAVKDILAE